MVLFCIKSLDPQRYTDLTGLKQQGALRFAAELKAQGVPFWLRYVLMPGMTDAPRDIERLTEFALQQPSLQVRLEGPAARSSCSDRGVVCLP
jgi:pyruvate formate lyase activating enzyme